MKKTFIVANWKSNKTIPQAEEWFRTFNSLQLTINKEEKEVIICPSFTLLPFVKESIVKSQLSIVVGAQNISSFDEGAYTGEINGKQIREFADYVLIGHSERRKKFSESEEMINLKISKAFEYDLTPIVCVSSLKQAKFLQEFKGNAQRIVAYEPLFAIGSGTADTPENANQMAGNIKDILGEIPVLYGGSVTSKNVKEFTQMPNINGVLIGGASLDAKEFYAIVQNA